MKLLSLYVDNFGKISNFKYDFKDNINTIYEENGWGKTTLTIFIKSMLYGLDRQERLKYTPWTNLTSFGGFLTIEVDGIQYRIERSFAPKRQTGDILKVYNLKTGKEVDMESNIGEKLLNLNGDSFERSVFIPQKDLDDGFGSDIEAKLANLIGGTNDTQSFDDAIDILKSREHTLRLNSKKGLIIDKKQELFDLEAEISEADSKISGIGNVNRNIELIDAELEFLKERKDVINTKITEYGKNQDKKVKLQLMTKYDEDIIEARHELEKNDKVFNGHDVTQQEVLNIRSKNKELQNLRLEYEVLSKHAKTPSKLETLNKMFNDSNIPTDEEITAVDKKIDRYVQTKNIIESHKVTPKKDKPILGIILCVLSLVILLGAGLTLLLYFLLDWGVKFLALPVSLAITSLFVIIGAAFSFMMTNNRNTNRLVGGHVKTYDFEMIRLDQELREFFGKYHLYSSDFRNNLFLVRNGLLNYKQTKEEYSTTVKSNESLENRIKLLDNEILHFLGQFNNSETARTTEERIGELNTHLRNKVALKANLDEKIKIKEEYIKQNDLGNLSDDIIDIEDLNKENMSIDNKIQSITHNKLIYINQLSELEGEMSRYDCLVLSRNTLTEEIRQLENEYRLIELSVEFLEKSQTSLLEKYVKPMKDSVNKYVSLMLKNTSEYNIDVNFKFQFITDNGIKGLDSYSRGYQSIISLCMRLALIDCLYPKEKPFIILDDPFVNFDDEKLGLCKNLMKDISKKYQIIYFTCHDSRKI
ncbi:MAG: hypothetical protein K6E20_03530 [Acholeplasmatales bacterium]|nr:hypothetical protein [Acholeplasmatales bacterium]